ncbi:dual specificity protein phosphatase family protein [Bacillus sp. EAC]|uniref:protein-tyrosine phosphatase family protein n=1 Tax=Bacillus sp. EAC TaxID=1978338 RepID=UPI000B44BB25|nr:dual specificity protein phosphatase family protein [Bacillus sp. EAC]
MSNKNYQELIKNRIYFGGVDEVSEMLSNENVDIVFDLRAKKYEVDEEYNRVHSPIVDEKEHQSESLKDAIDNVVNAFKNDQNVYFHCGGGNTRAGTLAIGTLLALDEAKTIEEAEEKVKLIRPTIKFNSEMKNAMKEIFPNK